MTDRRDVGTTKRVFKVRFWTTEESPAKGRRVVTDGGSDDFNDLALHACTLTFVKAVGGYRNPGPNPDPILLKFFYWLNEQGNGTVTPLSYQQGSYHNGSPGHGDHGMRETQ